jgi:hypothetical protein
MPEAPEMTPETASPDPQPPEPLHERFPALEKLAFSRRRNRVPFIQQNTASDCGAASLSMVLAYHGKHLRLDDVRKITGFGRDGADALAILSAARVFGLRGRGVKVEEVDDLKFLPPGSILHWQFNHFLVFERLTPEGAELVDPAGGRRKVSPPGSAGTSWGARSPASPSPSSPGRTSSRRRGSPAGGGASSSCCGSTGTCSSASWSPRGWCSSSPWRCRC